ECSADSRSGAAPHTAAPRRARWRARTGPGRATPGRPGRTARTGSTVRRRPGPAPSPCPDGRCPPSGWRPWPGPGPYRRPAGQDRCLRLSAWLHLDLLAVGGPVGVEVAGAVDPLVGVGAEEVALGLEQVGRAALAPEAVVVGQRRGEGRGGHAQGGRGG